MPMLFCPSSSSPSFSPIFLKSYSTSTIHLRLGFPFFFSSPWSVFQLLFYGPVPSTLTTRPTYSNLRTLITDFVINFLIHFYSKNPFSYIGLFILFHYFPNYRLGSSLGIATDYGLDGPGSNPGGYEIFRSSRTALGPTQPPVKWVPGFSRR